MWIFFITCSISSVLVFTSGQSSPECPNTWLSSPASQTCVKVFKTRIDWQGAREQCQAQGADLVRIPNYKMNKFVTGLINTTGDTRFWIGLHDTKKENTYVWLDDTKTATYINWASGQPNNYKSTRGSGDQDCVEIGTYTPQWQDDWCNRKAGYICEMPKSRVECLAGWTESRYSGTCVRLVTQGKRTWAQSRRFCLTKYGGDLVKIVNVQMDVLTSGLASARNLSTYWIGLHDVQTEGKYQWLDATDKPTYFNWADGQPNNYRKGKWAQAGGTGQDCGQVMLRAGKWRWYDSSCAQPLAFVCERQSQFITTTARTTTRKTQTTRSSKATTTTTTAPPTTTRRRRTTPTTTIPKTTPLRTTTRPPTSRIPTLRPTSPRTVRTTGKTTTTTPTRIRTTKAITTTPSKERTTSTPTLTPDAVGTPRTTTNINNSNQNRTQAPNTSSSVAWLLNPISGSELRASQDKKSWIDARTACQNQGGDLVKISDQTMNNFVAALISMNGGGKYWIGLHDVRTENKFVWLDEDEQIQYTNWAKGQPNNFIENKQMSEGQDCVEIGTFTPQWQDEACNLRINYICERQNGVAPNPLFDQPTDWLTSPQTDTMVKIFPGPKSWAGARRTCQGEDGDLVKILDQDMNSFLADLIRSRGGGRHWIGLNDLAQENTFVWLDGDKQANFTNWAAGQPNNYKMNRTNTESGQHCVEIGTFAPRWQDDKCSRHSKFICGRSVKKSATTMSTKCPGGWSASPVSDTCVKVYQDEKSWSGARDVCQSHGGDLVKIRGQKMNAFLAGLLSKDVTKKYWIGLHDTIGKNKYQWLDEKVAVNYTNWASLQPSSYIKEDKKTPKNCAVFGKLAPKWQAVVCSTPAGFVCELTARASAEAHTGQGAADHSGLIVAVILCTCLVAAGLAAFLVYRRRQVRKSLTSSDTTISFTNLVDESIFDDSPSGL